jgi:hypothetical protein
MASLGSGLVVAMSGYVGRTFINEVIFGSVRTGDTFINAELAAEYGVTDVDGRTIMSLRAERGAPVFGPVWQA